MNTNNGKGVSAKVFCPRTMHTLSSIVFCQCTFNEGQLWEMSTVRRFIGIERESGYVKLAPG